MPLGALACEKCQALLYSEELARISTRANSLEKQDDLTQAREEWLKEMECVVIGAAWQAMVEFDASRNVELGAYMCVRGKAARPARRRVRRLPAGAWRAGL